LLKALGSLAYRGVKAFAEPKGSHGDDQPKLQQCKENKRLRLECLIQFRFELAPGRSNRVISRTLLCVHNHRMPDFAVARAAENQPMLTVGKEKPEISI
jgi:hypothetical protein